MLALAAGRREVARSAARVGSFSQSRAFLSASHAKRKAYGDEPTIVPVKDGYREHQEIQGQGPSWWLLMIAGSYCFLGGTAGLHKSVGNEKDLGPNCQSDWQRNLGGITNREPEKKGRRWVEVPDEKGRF
ncbi:unnamed protein product [Amoebophrya sp. A25]|nr:unnamed protein product [Amoebophrya sp. A25]|eukprot:GSA25T00019148001.1